MESQTYRLDEIGRIRKILEGEEAKRMVLSKKYRRVRTMVDAIDVMFLIFIMGLNAGGVGLLTTVVPTRAVVGMQVLLFVLLCLAGKYVSGKLLIKVEKHEIIKTLPATKLNTIFWLISKALTDSKITDEEFQLISSELDKYYKMKDEVRRLARKEIEKKRITSFDSKQSS